MTEQAATTDVLQAILAPQNRQHTDPHLRSIGYLQRAMPIKCADGLEFSMQASCNHYCTPRDSLGPWAAVEIGFPSRRVEEFMEYIDGTDSDPTDTVYGYVPLATVAAAVDAAGGLAVLQ